MSENKQTTERTPGQIAYEKDVELDPYYRDGKTPRKQWHELSDLARRSWERNPTVRTAKATGA